MFLEFVGTFLFRMHVADPLMMHCGMGSVSSPSRGVAFDIWPRVGAWRWQSDAAWIEGSEARESRSAVCSERTTNHEPHKTFKSVNIMCSTTCFTRPACNLY